MQLLSSCTEYVADKECKLQWRSVGDPHVEKIFVWRRLTPELSRAAARLGDVVNATTLAEPRSGLGLNELLGLRLFARSDGDGPAQKAIRSIKHGDQKKEVDSSHCDI